MPRPILLDVDTGTDDALAILYAVRHPDLNVLGISCVAGNSGVDQVVTNTLKVLEAASARRDLPVARGAAQPLLERARPEGEFHGEDGLGGVILPHPAREPSLLTAVEMLRQQITASPEPVTPVGLAPQTNLALLLTLHPDVLNKVERVVFMGGGQPWQRHRGGRVQRLAGPRSSDLRDRVTGRDCDVRTGRLHPPGRRPGYCRSVQRLG